MWKYVTYFLILTLGILIIVLVPENKEINYILGFWFGALSQAILNIDSKD